MDNPAFTSPIRPFTTSTFYYRPLEEGSIRLVHFLPRSTASDIHCSLEHHSNPQAGTDQDHPYKALSYCWGDPNTTQKISLDGSPFRVTANLWTALSSLVQFHDTSQPFWIDAICINQSDVTERNHEVKRMWQIYSNAKHVYAWLGPEDEYTSLAWQTMRRLTRGCQASLTREGVCQKPSKDHKRMSKIAISAILLHAAREYYTRTWTLVESINARQISLLSGKFIIEADVFIHAILILQRQVHNLPFPNEFMNFIVARKRAAKLDKNSFRSADWGDWHEPFSLFTRTRSSDPRDKIFAMLSDIGFRRLHMPLEDLGPEYNWTADELVLIVIEFRSKMLQYEAEQDSTADDLSMIMLEDLRQAFGTPRKLTKFRAWFHSHATWTESWKSNGIVTTGTGRQIDCTGRIMDFLLNERNEKFPTFTMERSLSGHHGIITEYS